MEEWLFGTFLGSLIGAYLGYWTNAIYQKRSEARPDRIGFIWRPGWSPALSPYQHPMDSGDFLKFWFRLRGRSSPGSCSMELTYQPPVGEPTSVFAKWDETANPESEERLPNGDVLRHFFADRVPATFFLPLRTGRLYTVPILWGEPPAWLHEQSGIPLEEALRRKDTLLLFSGWWFSPERPRPKPVVEVDLDGHLKIVLFGEALHWEREFSIRELVMNSRPIHGGESDANQEQLRELLPAEHAWPQGTAALARQTLARLKR